MGAAILSVHQVGPQVSIQDAGRPGLMRFGVPASGPMDRGAFAIANLALGNPAGAAGIEVSRGGLVMDCVRGAVTLAIAGGGFVVEHRGQRSGSWAVLTLRAGERLALRPGPWGSWTYIAFAGQLGCAKWLGSAATHASSGFGGGALREGQEITIAALALRPEREGAIPCPVWARPAQVLNVVAGPQDRYFPPEALQDFLGSPFTLTDAGDRMGVRLRGPRIAPVSALSIPSEAICRGSVQVSGDGTATVLLADHQTTGGYPKIATLLSHDTDRFAQLRPRAQVSFAAVSPEHAVALARMQHRLRQSFLQRFRPGA